MSCEFCSNYHLNSHARLDDCCLGKGDCRKEYFSCNSDLAPKAEKPRTRKEFDDFIKIRMKDISLHIENLNKLNDDTIKRIDEIVENRHCVRQAGKITGSNFDLYFVMFDLSFVSNVYKPYTIPTE